MNWERDSLVPKARLLYYKFGVFEELWMWRSSDNFNTLALKLTHLLLLVLSLLVQSPPAPSLLSDAMLRIADRIKSTAMDMVIQSIPVYISESIAYLQENQAAFRNKVCSLSLRLPPPLSGSLSFSLGLFRCILDD